VAAVRAGLPAARYWRADTRALSLQRSNLDFENLLITVNGKGNKQRIVPMGFELRKVLWKYGKMHDFDRFFPSRHGGKLEYHNLLEDFKALCKKLGIAGLVIAEDNIALSGWVFPATGPPCIHFDLFDIRR
jgi:hypothetical protein